MPPETTVDRSAVDTLLLLVRHAEQETMRVADAPLSARGRRQADLLAARLGRLPLTAVVSSRLARARETAAAVATAARLAPEVEDGLEEVAMADEERLRRYADSAIGGALQPPADPEDDDGYARVAVALLRIVPGVRWSSLPGVESIESMRTRGLAAVDRILQRNLGGVVAVVSHAGMLNALLGAWTGAAADMWFAPWHTGISSVAVNGEERVVLGLNDASHLGPREEMLAVVARNVRAG